MSVNDVDKVLIDKELLEYREKIIRECKDVLEKVENDLEDFISKYVHFMHKYEEALVRAIDLKNDDMCKIVYADKHVKLLYDFINLLGKTLDYIRHDVFYYILITLKVLKKAYLLLEKVRDPEMEDHIIKESYDKLKMVISGITSGSLGKRIDII